jgi:CBS domain containing-hemolysin-like protein
METLRMLLVRFGPYLAVLAGILVAAVANGMETGIYRLNRIRLRLRAEAGDRRARTLAGLLGDVRGLIVVCLVGYNVGVYVATAFVTTLVEGAGWARGPVGVEILATVLLAPIFFVFTDVTPKSIFTYEADRWMYRLAGLLRGGYVVLRSVGLVPALKGASTLVLRIAHGRDGARANPFHPRQRLRAFLREGAAEGVITGYQDELVERVLALRERQVRDVMIPLARVTAVEAGIGREQFVEQLRAHSYSRLPVWEGRQDHIVGIVHINDVLGAEAGPFDLGRVMTRQVVEVPPEMPVGQAMFRMRAERAAMAVVCNPRGRAVGIITIKDLVEEIVGELAVW